MKYTVFVICLFVFFQHTAFGQNRIYALRTDEKIALDGKLDEESWSRAVKISNFTQRELDNGATPTEKTEVAVIYNTHRMYIGVWCWDSEPDRLIATKMVRDFSGSTEDNFCVVIDTYHDKRNCYLFGTNPNGARTDALLRDDGNQYNDSWNGIWDVETTVNDKGWFIEIEIPFSTLKFSEDSVQLWGINFERNIRRKQEQVLWQAWSRDNSIEHVSKAGELLGLSGIAADEAVELKPYITAGYEDHSGSDKFVTKIGGDVNYLITPNLKLNLTVNTDFAQVESDRVITNLTRYSVFYDEKREFFLEGMDFFGFQTSGNVQVFYSRKIGASNSSGGIPIIAGAKLFGKVGGTNIGAITMQLSEKDREPSTNYTVVRVKQDIMENSTLGMIVTAKNSSRSYNYVYGLDFRYYTPTFLGNKRLELSASIAHSITKDSANDNSVSYRIYAEYPNDEINIMGGFVGVPKGFNPEIGYVRRTDFTSPFCYFGYTPRFDSSFVRNLSFAVNIDSYNQMNSGRLETNVVTVKPFGMTLKSGESFGIFIYNTFDRLYEPYTIGGKITIDPGIYKYNDCEFSFSTFVGRPVYGTVELSQGGFFGGSKSTFYASVAVNADKNLNFSADYTYNDIDINSIGLKTNNFGGKVVYAFNPKLNTSLFGQWNDGDQSVVLNYRVNWIPEVGSDFYFVLNQAFDTSGRSIAVSDFSVFCKYIWRLGI